MSQHKCHISGISDESLQGFQLVIEQNGLVFAQQSQDAAQACLPPAVCAAEPWPFYGSCILEDGPLWPGSPRGSPQVGVEG